MARLAICAPGTEPWAMLVLALKGEDVDEVRSSPILTDWPNGPVIFIVDDSALKIDKLPIRVAPTLADSIRFAMTHPGVFPRASISPIATI